ncbi:hypothetical protein HPB50_009415 [Hyalomma asiaticum]|uniref:Uncharacterized protein n=1 Tax=Hyalomma asiaticum TaxID=266040 RepID=A0ACB7SZ92_HYAAI|nr:hypothetical protein HPB50_009415 [Hyalomma asiaticum]
MRSSNEVTKLRKVYDQVLINMRGQEALGFSKAAFLSMLCDTLLTALPHDTVVNYYRSCDTHTASSTEDSAHRATELQRLLTFCIELESLENSDFGGHRSK